MAKVNGGIVTLTSGNVVTTAGTVTTTAVTDADYDFLSAITSANIETLFTYGSGGTSCKVYIQTSLDGGTTWFDIAQHAFTTASANKVSAITTNIAPASQAFTPSDAALTDNTIIQGVLGDRYRLKIVSVGTYAGSTTVKVYMSVRF